MKRQDAARYAANAPLLKSVARLPKIKHGRMPARSVRNFSHDGHDISIITTYEVKIDGRRAHLPLIVGDDGQVQGHVVVPERRSVLGTEPRKSRRVVMALFCSMPSTIQ